MATAPYQRILQEQRRGNQIVAERNATNDIYAEYALANQGKYNRWSGSVATAASPKFFRPYTYDELVIMGTAALPKNTVENLTIFNNI